MGKTKKQAGSSTAKTPITGTRKRKQPDSTTEEAPVNIACDYSAPFPIYSEIEGDIYKNMKSLSVTPPRSYDWDLMKTLGIENDLRKYLGRLGLEKYAEMELPGYDMLCREFYASMELTTDSKSFTCRFLGKTYEVTETLLESIFGFPVKGARKPKPTFDTRAAWKELTGFDNWNSSGTANGFVKDPVLAILHKFIAYNVFGNDQANKVHSTDVFLLICAKKGTKVSPTKFILDHMHSIKRRPNSHPTLCSIITGIAAHFGVVNLDGSPPPGNELLDCKKIGFHELRGAPFISTKKQILDFKERKCVHRFLNERAARAQEEGTSTPAEGSDGGNNDEDQATESHSEDTSQATRDLLVAEIGLLKQSLQSFRDHFDTSLAKLREDIFGCLAKQHQEIAALRAQTTTSNLTNGGPQLDQPPDQQ